MDDSLYDEFGNYIGPELSGSDEACPSCSAEAPFWPLKAKAASAYHKKCVFQRVKECSDVEAFCLLCTCLSCHTNQIVSGMQ